MATCPVCGRDVEVENPAETDYGDQTFAPARAEYDDETYYFCSDGCKHRFEDAPGEYA